MNRTPRRSSQARDFGQEYPFVRPASTGDREPKILGAVLFELDESGVLAVPETREVDVDTAAQAVLGQMALAAEAHEHQALVEAIGSPDDPAFRDLGGGMPLVR